MSSPYNTVTFTYRTDPSAGAIPAQVHFSARPTTSAPKPLALIFHAGGFTVGSSAMVPATEIAALIKLGFIVVCPDFRLAPQVGIYAGALFDSKWCLRWTQHELPSALKAKARLDDGKPVLADGSRVVVAGHSAGGTLALLVGAEPNGPKAVLDMYGPVHFQHSFWSRPLGAFAKIPKLDEAFVGKVFDGPVPTSSPPMFKDGKPDLSTPRNAWMIGALRDGNQMELAIKDGGVARVDPLTFFHAEYPPTMIVHGTKDIFAPRETSLVAYARLRELGVDVEMVDVDGAAHVFDFTIGENDPLFTGPVMKGLRFLAEQVGL